MDVPPPVLDDKARAELLEKLGQFSACVPQEVTLALRVDRCDSVHEGIQTFASSAGVDLLVMGSHGRVGVKRILLGSVAERVIRQAPCPTMIVPARAHSVAADAPVRFTTILCPVDFSDHSLLAAEYAVSLAEETDAQLRLLHVVSMPPGLEELESTLADLRTQVEGDRLRRLEHLIPAEALNYCTVQSAVRSGTVHQQILAAADEQPSDLIVLGAHGRGAVGAAFFGSNAARVARGANCPVLVVRHVGQPRVES
jgi:nucleotide-binding universal stress UspA family protein